MTIDGLVARLQVLDTALLICGLVAAAGAVGSVFVGLVRLKNSNELQRLQTAENLAQQKEVALLQLQSAQLQAKIMPRDLTETQQQAIGVACKQFSGRSVRITADSSDPESWLLAELIQEALKHGGINSVYLPSQGVTWVSMSRGILIGGADKDLVAGLKNALESIGNLNVSEDEELSKDVVLVALGVRPFVKAR